MTISFTKMQGLGNDFVVMDATDTPFSLSTDMIARMGDRRYGVGFDQLLVLSPANSQDVDFNYRIFNADGREVEQCGNGARCMAAFIYQQQLSDRASLRLQSIGGVLNCDRLSDNRVRVTFPAPIWEPANIPINAAAEATSYQLRVDDQVIDYGAVSLGNPHVVVQVPDLSSAALEPLAACLSTQDCFPAGANVGFMQCVSDRHIHLRVYERGVGQTLACGSGACAAVLVGRRWGLLSSEVCVSQAGGDLKITCTENDQKITMSGEVATVFTGNWHA